MADEKNLSPDNSSEGTIVADNWAETMKEDMEEYIEEQGIYIRQ